MIDGVIKYNFTKEHSKEPSHSAYIHIEEARARLFALKLIGSKDNVGYGNISQRVDGPSFIITATQTGHLLHLTGTHYTVVNSCHEESFSLSYSGIAKPSSESFTHHTLYSLNSSINAVIHVHNSALWQYMLNRNYLSTPDIEYGSIEMMEATKALYLNQNPLNNPLFAMHGHKDGIICFGTDIKSAEHTLLQLIGELIEHNSP